MDLETFFSQLTSLRGKTDPERAHVAALGALIEAAGQGITPAVKVGQELKNIGVGKPDLGIFDVTQLFSRREIPATDDELGLVPSHGVVEAKAPHIDLLRTAHDRQVKGYVERYGRVLVTNFYQFIVVTRGAPEDSDPKDGQSLKAGEKHYKVVLEERYDIAASAEAFWEAAQHPKALAKQHEAPLRDFFRRYLGRMATLTNPQDVAWLLASYAREALSQVNAAGNIEELNQVRADLEQSLGMTFEGMEGAHFFNSTLIQTLFYVLFSAWALWSVSDPPPPADARFDTYRTTPEISIPTVLFDLFWKMSNRKMLKQVGVLNYMDWTEHALNRVERTGFFETFARENAIQYFYEPFLREFDPELRKALGVWYTPPDMLMKVTAEQYLLVAPVSEYLYNQHD